MQIAGSMSGPTVSGLRAEQTKLCALVVIGVNERGEKRFLAIEDGVRESTQSWREVLLKLKSRGMNVPKLAIGDGAMGFWGETRQQRCLHERPQLPAQVGPGEGETGPALDLSDESH